MSDQAPLVNAETMFALVLSKMTGGKLKARQFKRKNPSIYKIVIEAMDCHADQYKALIKLDED